MRRYFNVELKSKYLDNVTYYIEADNTVRKTFMFHNGNKSVNFIKNTNYTTINACLYNTIYAKYNNYM